MIHRSFRAATMLLLAAVLFSLSLTASGIPEPSKEFYVLDSSGVIDAGTEAYIIEKNDALFDAVGAQIVVVTVDFVPNGDLEQYAYSLFNSWQIGSDEENNGILLLISVGDDDYWCLQGKGLEASLSSGTIGNLLEDYLEPDFARQNYSAGIRKVFDALYEQLAAISGWTPESVDTGITEPLRPVDPEPIYRPEKPGSAVPRSGGFLKTLLIVILAVMLIRSFTSGGVYAGGGTSSGCGGFLLGLLLGNSFGHSTHSRPFGRSTGGFGSRPFGGHSGGFGGNSGGFGGNSGGNRSRGPRSGGGGSSRGGGAGRRR